MNVKDSGGEGTRASLRGKMNQGFQTEAERWCPHFSLGRKEKREKGREGK